MVLDALPMAVVKHMLVMCLICFSVPNMSAGFVGSSLMQFENSEQSHDVVLSLLMKQIERQEARLQELELTVSENEERALEREWHITQLETRISVYEEAMMERDQRIVQLQTRMSVFEEVIMATDKHIAQPALNEQNNTLRNKDYASSLGHDNITTQTANPTKEDTHMTYDPNLIESSLHELVEEKTTKHKPSIRVSPAVTPGTAFSVFVSVTKTNLPVNEVIVYNDVMTDIGSGYNQRDGIYTVPASGVYVFTWTTISDFHSDVGTTIQINGAVEGVLGSFGDSINNYQSATGIIVKSVTAGDHVYIKSNLSGFLVSDSGARPTFSGWRLF